MLDKDRTVVILTVDIARPGHVSILRRPAFVIGLSGAVGSLGLHASGMFAARGGKGDLSVTVSIDMTQAWGPCWCKFRAANWRLVENLGWSGGWLLLLSAPIGSRMGSLVAHLVNLPPAKSLAGPLMLLMFDPLLHDVQKEAADEPFIPHSSRLTPAGRFIFFQNANAQSVRRRRLCLFPRRKSQDQDLLCAYSYTMCCRYCLDRPPCREACVRKDRPILAGGMSRLR